MRSLIAAAFVLAAMYLFTPAPAAAQDPPSLEVHDTSFGVASPQQAPPPAEGAVPRTPQNRVPDASRRSGPGAEPSDKAQGSSRAGSRDEERGARRREVVAGDPADNSGAISRPAASAAAASAAEDDQRGAQRRGSVRRPPTEGGTVERAIPRAEAPPPPQSRGRAGRGYPYYPSYPYYSRYYDPWGYSAFGLGYFYYTPWNWVPYGYGYPRYGGVYGFDVGSVKIKVKPRDAEVWVDGYYAGAVDDFDGVFQALRLDSGAYRIEIRKPGFETLTYDLRVQPERTITVRGELRPAP